MQLCTFQVFYSTPYEVHYNSNRLGVRLDGPAPTWARKDGGGGGSHPSNVHDHTYAIGTVNFTGRLNAVSDICKHYIQQAFSATTYCSATSPIL